MDVVNAGIVSFVTLVFVGATIAYVAAPDETMESLAPEWAPQTAADACKLSFDECAEGPREPSSPQDDGEDDWDEDDDRDEEDRDGKGKGKGRDKRDKRD